MNKSILIMASVAMAVSCVHAAEADKHQADIDPVLIDSNNGTGATLGLEYKLKGNLLSRSFDSGDSGGGIDPAATLGTASISYQANGTVTADKARNPKNFIEFKLDADWTYSAAGTGSWMGGLFTKYEADQSFDKRQTVYGLSGSYAKYGVLAANDEVGFDSYYGRVDPKDDAERKKLLGATAGAESYNRWNLELLYKYPLDAGLLSDIEFNYRYFKETGAPAVIKTAGLDDQELATVRLGLKNDLYIAYSVGKLPFDHIKDRIYQVGFSYKLW